MQFNAFFKFSTLMRRVPEPESSRWAHMSLYLRTKDSSVPGVWMEDYKFLAAYKLKATVSEGGREGERERGEGEE